MKNKVKCVVVTAPTNIALVKYWGKRCKELNLPLNSSLSVTLSQDHLKTTTKVKTCPTYETDEVWLNGIKQDVDKNNRLTTVLSEIRAVGRKQIASHGNASAEDVIFLSQKVHVHTENNFPTAAGLASSASGYAALVFALGKLFGIQGDLTPVARRGSGSACRSLHGGFVEWKKGEREDGLDSIGIQVMPESHWPELRIFVVVANDNRKKVGSTEGMERSVQTSTLLSHRYREVVEHRMKAIRQAISERDFSKLSQVIMRDSNQLHAICLDTYPPLHYLSDVSRKVMDLVHSYNEFAGSPRVAYSFDAGPNACLFTTAEFADELASIISFYFQVDHGDKVFFKGLPVNLSIPSDEIQSKMKINKYDPGLVKYIVHTNVGTGPQVVVDEEGTV